MQLDIQDRFKESIRYARIANENPVLKALYAAVAKRGQSAFNVAFKDAFLEPEVKLINLTHYHGVPGDVIFINADEFKVVSMLVVISTPGGEVIESGNAVLKTGPEDSSLGWKYIVTTANDVLPGTKIKVTAKDRPGHEVVKEIVVV